MATTASIATDRGQCILLHDVSWETYLDLLDTPESQKGSIRMSYNQGRLQIVSPSQHHESGSQRLGLIVRLSAMAMGLNCLGIGSTTLKNERAHRGKEADVAFYLANEPRVRGKRIELDEDPPPDLAIEVEVAHRDADMLAIYASLGVPEVWIYDGEVVKAFVLQPDGTYQPAATSLSLPFLPLGEIPRWLEFADTAGETAMSREFLDWVRNELAPRSE